MFNRMLCQPSRIHQLCVGALLLGVSVPAAAALTGAQTQAESACKRTSEARNQLGESDGYLYMPTADQKLAKAKLTAIDKAIGRCLAQPRPAAWQMQKARDEAASALDFVKGLVKKNAAASQKAFEVAAKQKQVDKSAREVVTYALNRCTKPALATSAQKPDWLKKDLAFFKDRVTVTNLSYVSKNADWISAKAKDCAKWVADTLQADEAAKALKNASCTSGGTKPSTEVQRGCALIYRARFCVGSSLLYRAKYKDLDIFPAPGKASAKQILDASAKYGKLMPRAQACATQVMAAEHQYLEEGAKDADKCGKLGGVWKALGGLCMGVEKAGNAVGETLRDLKTKGCGTSSER